jgi:hypothetical protein
MEPDAARPALAALDPGPALAPPLAVIALAPAEAPVAPVGSLISVPQPATIAATQKVLQLFMAHLLRWGKLVRAVRR